MGCSRKRSPKLAGWKNRIGRVAGWDDKYGSKYNYFSVKSRFLRKKDSFPKTVSDMCCVLAGSKNRYGSK